MKSSSFAWVLGLLCLGLTLNGQTYQGILPKIETNADSLIRQVFVAGQCIDIQEVRSQSQFGQIGTFTNGLSSIGIDEGIILSTGNVMNVRGPNNEDDAGTGFGQVYNDPDFTTIANASTQYDLAYLEFDFIPTVDFVRFEYVFASEEYCEFSSSPTFNDAFAFLISGPGINGPFSNGAENIARLPSGAFVSANTINYFTNPAFYVGNVAPNTTPFCPNSPATALQLTEFDGFTTVLTAAISVVPCERYRIRLAIMDKNDDVYDSAVFLKASSFNAGIPATISSTISAEGLSDTQPYEGCSDAFFIFERVGGDTSQDLTVHFAIDPSSTATQGLDFMPFADSVIIPALALLDTMRVSILPDGLLEGEETLTLRLINPCYCDNSSVTIRIIDPPVLEVARPDTIACYGKNISLSAEVDGGVGPLLYDWGNGNQDSILQLTPLASQSLLLSVSDQCGQEHDVPFSLSVERLEASFANDDYICVGKPAASLPILLSGASSYNLEVLYGNDTLRYSSLSGSQFDLPAPLAGLYHLLELSSANCTRLLSASAQVDSISLDVDAQLTHPACAGQTTGRVQLIVNGGRMPYGYQWQGSPIQAPIVDNLGAGEYAVTVSDAGGCLQYDTFLLVQPQPLLLHIDSLFNPDCTQPEGRIFATASGGNAPYQWFYEGGASDSTLVGLSPGTHALSVRDVLGCETTEVVTLSDLRAIPSAEIQASDDLNCYHPSITLQATPQPGATYLWSGPQGDINQADHLDTLSVNEPGVYQLVVRNQSAACADTTTLTVDASFQGPAVDAGEPAQLNCNTPSATLTGSLPGFNGMASWLWSSPGRLIPNANAQQITVGQTGWYYATATDLANGCQSTDSLLVTADSLLPSLALPLSDTINCLVTSLNLQAQATGQGPISYTWNTPDGLITGPTNTPQVVVSRGGWYRLTITDSSNGCQATDSLKVAENRQVPLLNAGPDSTLDCRQNSLYAVAQSTALDPQWAWSVLNNNLILSDSASLHIHTADSYQVLVTDRTNGCQALDTVVVQANFRLPTPNAGQDTSLNCQYPLISLTGAVDVPEEPISLVWLNTNGDTLSVGTAPLVVDQAGTYILQATLGQNGCSQMDSVQVGANFGAPTLFLQIPDTLNCLRSQTNLQVSASPAAPLHYQWRANPPAQLTGPTNQSTATATATGWYFITATNTSNGCATTDSIQVVADLALPQVDAGPTDSLDCLTTTLQLQGSGQAPAGLSFSWTGPTPASILSGQQTANPRVQSYGWYYLQGQSIGNGCIQVDSVFVAADTLSPNVSVLLEGQLTCTSRQVRLLPEPVSSGYAYQWTNPAGAISHTPVLTTSLPGPHSLRVSDLRNGCAQTLITQVSANTSPPQAVAGPANAFLDCTQGTVSLHADASSSLSGMLLYTWSLGLPGGGFSPIPNGQQSQITATQAGIYQVVVTDPVNGCTDSTSIQVGAHPDIEALVSTVPPLCAGDRAEIAFTSITGGLPPFSYSIDGGQTFGSNPVFSQLPPAAYAWVVEDVNGCQASGQVLFVEPEPLSVELPDQLTLDFGSSTTLQPLVSPDTTTALLVQWSPSTGLACPSCLISSAAPPITQTYSLQITNQNGCTAQTQIRLIVSQKPNIYIPNAFSPHDENGVNDFFTIYAPAEVVKVVEVMKIFDRWGGLVFQTGPIPPGVEALGWDGRWRGQPLNGGVYVYYLSVELADGRKLLLEGEVTLLK